MRWTQWPGRRNLLFFSLFALTLGNSAAQADLMPITGSMTQVTVVAGFSSPTPSSPQTFTNLPISPGSPPVSQDPNSPVNFVNTPNSNMTTAVFGAAQVTN